MQRILEKNLEESLHWGVRVVHLSMYGWFVISLWYVCKLWVTVPLVTFAYVLDAS